MTKRNDIKAKAISLLRDYVITGLRLISLIGLMSLIGLEAQAQNQDELEAIQQGLSSIVVGGNVYGGGNKGKVAHNTTVNVKSGNLNSVFGGARMGEVGGRSFVNVEGEEAISDIYITNVYGGNDVAGTIGQTAATTVPVKTDTYPSGLTEVLAEGETKADHPEKNEIDNTWKTFVRTSRSTKEENGKTVEDHAIVIGSLYGGGNGDFDYVKRQGTENDTKDTYDIYDLPRTNGDVTIATVTVDKGVDPKPDLAKTYLEVLGGDIAHVYGGGNNATVTENTTICINNESDVLGNLIERYAQYLYSSSQYNTENNSLAYYEGLLFNYLKDRVDLSTFQSAVATTDLNFARIYGGNNKAEMKIRPTWNLQKGIIRDLYSGGNEGNMTWREGLLLDIDPVESDKLIIENVYGGCRRADVRPLEANGQPVEENAIQLSDKDGLGQLKYKFPAGFPARVLVRGGQVTNVYGGNDISGHIYGGNAVGIYTTVLGNVYGGGNGSYAYTDNGDLGKLKTFEDYYYNIDEVKAKHNANNPDNQISSLSSVEALNIFRPDAEQVSIRLLGTEDKPTLIKGSVFLGGNSATIETNKQNPKVELKIGSYVIADKVFMGNSGENMAKEDILKLYAGRVDADGNVLTNNDGSLATTGGEKYSTISLIDQTQMNTYMKGAAFGLNPNTEDRIVFDDGYLPYSTKIGSFFCGGNVGSMNYAGTQNMYFKLPVIIFDKLVGGCNNADVEPKYLMVLDSEGNPVLDANNHLTYHTNAPLNAFYEGGVLGSDTEAAETNGKTAFEGQNRLVMNIDGIKIVPQRWDDTFELVHSYDDDISNNNGKLIRGKEYYTTDLRSSSFIADGSEVVSELTGAETYYKLTKSSNSLTWNTAIWNDDENDFESTNVGSNNNTDFDSDRRLLSGNIYGGCYNSGHVNGNVVINIKQDIIKRDEVFAETNNEGEIIEANRNSGVILDEQRDDLMTVAMAVFGAGKGEGTEIWGSTTVNLNEGYAFQIFGGGEEGYVGKKKKDGNGEFVLDGNDNFVYEYDPAYSSTVNLNGLNAGYSEETTGNNLPVLAETEYIYGAGNEGDVCGDSYVYLGNGRIYDSFGGASDADVYGRAETYIGRQIKNGNIIDGFPWVRDIVYGGNDFGGTVQGNGEHDADFFKNKVRTETGANAFDVLGKIYNPDEDAVPHVLEAPVYVEYLQGRVDTIFGGSYGNYKYDDPMYQYEEEDEQGNLVTISPEAPYIESAFVNFRPNTLTTNSVTAVFGAGTGYPDYREGDKSQDHSYVLIDIPDGVNNFSNMEVYGSGSYNGLGMREPVLPMNEVAQVAAVNPVEDPGENATDEEKQEYENYLKYKEYQDYLSLPERLNNVSAVIDLVRGKIGTAYGGSFNEGITRRTMVNVPSGSTINIGAIFGGAYGNVTLDPCDVYEANVNYHSDLATLRYNPPRIISSDNKETLVGFDKQTIDNLIEQGESVAGNILEKGSIYGGNNHQRRTLYAKINIDVPVNQKHYKYGTSKGYVYGAGCGSLTWAEYTEVNLNANPDPAKPGAQVWEVYGGGQDGLVINAPGIQQYINKFYSAQGVTNFTDPHWKIGWLLGDGYDQEEFEEDFESGNDAGVSYVTNTNTNLNNPLVTPRIVLGEEKRFNTNVIINEGAYVGNYAYGGGLGHKNLDQSGNVYGTTYIALLGGEVKKDIYAAGSSGGVFDAFNVGAQSSSNLYGFTASTTAYIEGGTCRNVYGGGWEGNVGGNSFLGEEIDGETNVVIGILEDQLPTVPTGKTETDYHFHNGIPAIQRNAYAGGEGGSIIGTANITVNNGRIGYVYLKANQKQDEQGYIVSVQEARAQDSDDSQTSSQLADRYEEKINDETNWAEGVWKGEGSLTECGNVFGSGYDDLSSVDESEVTLYGGLVRNCVYGGGEIAIVGRGTRTDANTTTVSITKAGQTNVNMYGGQVLRNVYGGGKGYNALGLGGGHNKYTEGYVFGQTRVNIFGGEIGTTKGVLEADEPGDVGNVFGGGDAGFVYSAYEDENGEVAYGKKSGVRFDGGDEGYYYKSEKGTNGNYGFITLNNEKILTEDCKVLVEPRAKATATVNINNVDYAKDTYVPTSALNLLNDKDDTRWENIDVSGIIIHNAVFAGGNIASKKQMSADIPSVFGNATASIHDVYHRDLITIGTGQVGGIYGDGNLTLVDGYRELNITNYGTDYYYITKQHAQQIGIETYNNLTPREQDYYEVKYKCVQQCTDNENTTYTANSTLLKDELLTRFAGNTTIINDNNEPNSAYWVQVGQMSNYSGRLLNTIQRADFCGIFGSRMVMKGAKDRLVSADVDDNDYTINRVREVSLNKKESIISSDTGDDTQHGNYFGIYNTVNYLGALTSDFDFGDATTNNTTWARQTDNSTQSIYETAANGKAYGIASFYDWKAEYWNDPRRNNGLSHNQVALGSGVSLELLTEKTTGKQFEQKDWGIITGVVQLDLINVATGIGGGYVYAKNIHGERKATGKTQTILTALNKQDAATGTPAAATMKSWEYIETNPALTGTYANQKEFQTSGNFVHNTKTILDDCYNIKNRYRIGNRVPAHYWYIQGSVYVYDQVISAYTGSPNAYSESVEIPLTITSASHGQLKLIDVKPNRYALYSSYTDATHNTKLTAGSQLVINDVTYNLNDPISYWDWSNLPESEQKLFREDTYVNCVDVCIDNGTLYPAGTYVMTKDEFDDFGNNHTYTDAEGHAILDNLYEEAGTDYVFRQSNNVSHDNGYILTYQMNNPSVWDTWYTPSTGSASNKNQTGGNGYETAPTYRPSAEGLYGQQEYGVSEIITEDIFKKYEGKTIDDSGNDVSAATSGLKQRSDYNTIIGTKTQATFERAYITTEYVETTNIHDIDQHLQEGAKLAKSQYSTTEWTNIASKVAPAYVSTTTIQLSETKFIYPGDLMTATQKEEFKDDYPTLEVDIEKAVVPAYYCTDDGYYGGDYYLTTNNYPAKETFNAMSGTDDFAKFKNGFNYDALDLLIDPNYGGTKGEKYQYDGYTSYDVANKDKMIYSLKKSVDYSAIYSGTDDLQLFTGQTVTVTRTENNTTTTAPVSSIKSGDLLDRKNYEENLINEQSHYIPITIASAGTYYVVNTPFYYDESFAAGQIISEDVFGNLPDGTNSTEDFKSNVTQLTFDGGGTYYYCRDAYTIAADGKGGKPVQAVMANTQGISSTGTTVSISNEETRTYGSEVPVGFIIGADDITETANEVTTTVSYGYNSLTNQQKGFTIEGIAPVETSTLYVARNSDIKDLSKEKIITVVYQYDYEESNLDGTQISPVSERHVVNIHLRFVSGEPYVANIEAPGIVLPGTSVIPEAPSVVAGGYLIMNRGWEIYENAEDAKNHINGIEYVPSNNPLYWYQDGYQIAYYAKTYLGKHYSNYVPLSVANYHRMDDVLNLTTTSNGNETVTTVTTDNHYMYLNQAVKGNKRNPKVYIKDDNELNKFAAFYNETRTKSELSDITSGQNIDFIIDGNINHSGDWTSIGGGNNGCFEGTLHGDGYTISGLNNSLFGSLCGDVYNLGVTGTFTGAGIAESGSGYIENGWISTTSTAAKTSKPVFGDPARTGTALTQKGKIQIVNSYYQEDDDAVNKYTNHSGDYGIPTRKPAAAFYNGEVAYDLNSFYLNKRYYNYQTLGEDSRVSYKFLQRDENGNLKETADIGYYPKDKTTYAEYADLGYVESRYGDGDYRYAGGEIPTSTDKRERTYEVTTTTENPDTHEIVTTTTSETGWFPVWPEDYLFFGQNLTYGYINDKPHQSVPSHFYSNTASNRVYRAPAYFRSSTMSVAHYNPDAILAAKSADGTRDAYPGMTAIDFAGHNDIDNGYKQGLKGGLFYQPLLDDDGLTSISNEGETSNLLVYAPAATSTNGSYANQNTFNVLSSYFTDPKFSDYDETSSNGKYTDGKTYGRVAAVSTNDVHGHLVLNDFTTPGDHLLIDRQDFNAPLSYKLGDGYRMWYQRTPEHFAETAWDNNKRTTIGWEGVSIPFEAEYVTTNTKGEITHFYRKDDSGTYEKGYNTGHEYWLRKYEGVAAEATTATDIAATFLAPLKTSLVSKIDKNTFLWDYYYSLLNRKDKNSDDYQSYQTEYYKKDRTYAGYPRITGGTPYIIGFPGEQYYEFDLSGNWTPSNTANDDTWEKMGKQTITFASAEAENGHPVTISVSDTEAVGITKKGLTFQPSYLNKEYNSADATTYLLSNDGSSFDQVNGTITREAFRPYFTGTYDANGAAPRRIIISGGEDTTIKPDVEEHNGNAGGSLKISVEGHTIVVESTLHENATVRITTTSGVTVTTFTIKPGQIVRTPVAMTGVYVVNRTKVIVK